MEKIRPKELRSAENTFSYVKHFINPSDEVLDVGSGTGLVADLVWKNITKKVRCIDIIDINMSSVPLSIYDGKHVPFPDSSFDVILCAFVLHHMTDQEFLIKEMIRASRSKIIICEDTPCNIIDRLFNLNHALTSKIKYKSGKMKFRTIVQWTNLFAGLGLSIEKIVEISKDRDPFYPTNRRVFILRK